MKHTIQIYITIILSLMLLKVDLYGQCESRCNQYSNQFYRAIEESALTKADYHYFKLLNSCGVTSQEKDKISSLFSQYGFEFEWTSNELYRITYIPCEGIDPSVYYKVMNYDDLHPEHSIKLRFPTEKSFFDAISIDTFDMAYPPSIVADYGIIWLHYYTGDILLDIRNLQPIHFFNDQYASTTYIGGGNFMVTLPNEVQIFKCSNKLDGVDCKLVIKHHDNIYFFPKNNNETYFLIDTLLGNGSYKSYLVNQEGTYLLSQYDHILHSPLSSMLIVRKDNKYQLLNNDIEIVINNANYIYEVWNDQISYYIVEMSENSKFIFDKYGNKLLDISKYTDIFIDRSPYAIVKKSENYGVLEIPSGKIVVPFRSEKLHQLVPGFFMFQKGDIWYIVDDENCEIHQLEADKCALLYDAGIALLKLTNREGKVGVTTILGTEILPVQYKHINLSSDNRHLQVIDHQSEFLFDLRGIKTE